MILHTVFMMFMDLKIGRETISRQHAIGRKNVRIPALRSNPNGGPLIYPQESKCVVSE